MATDVGTYTHMDVAAERRLYDELRDHFWYPVAYSDDLTDSPQGFTLFERPLVVVRLGGEAKVFEDICRHRGAALSLGKVVGDCIRCPYHGWEYDSNGSVSRIPQREELSKLVDASLPSYPTVEVSGLVYTCLGEPKFPAPSVPEFEDDSYRFIHLDIYEWNCSMQRRLENYFDFAHFAWVHDGILGDSNQPRVEDYDIQKVGSELRFIAGPFPEFTDNVKNAPSSTTDSAGEIFQAMKRYSIFVPNAMRLNSAAGATEDYILWVCLAPVSPTRTRCFTYQGRNYGFERDAEFRRFAEVINEQDQPIVESQRPAELPRDLAAEMYIKGSDRAALEYRKWLFEISRGTVQMAPA